VALCRQDLSFGLSIVAPLQGNYSLPSSSSFVLGCLLDVISEILMDCFSRPLPSIGANCLDSTADHDHNDDDEDDC
jgi:hypothetical protein